MAQSTAIQHAQLVLVVARPTAHQQGVGGSRRGSERLLVDVDRLEDVVGSIGAV